MKEGRGGVGLFPGSVTPFTSAPCFGTLIKLDTSPVPLRSAFLALILPPINVDVGSNLSQEYLKISLILFGFIFPFFDLIKAANPATSGADIEVPDILIYELLRYVLIILSPGAATSTQSP